MPLSYLLFSIMARLADFRIFQSTFKNIILVINNWACQDLTISIQLIDNNDIPGLAFLQNKLFYLILPIISLIFYFLNSNFKANGIIYQTTQGLGFLVQKTGQVFHSAYKLNKEKREAQSCLDYDRALVLIVALYMQCLGFPRIKFSFFGLEVCVNHA